MANDFTIRGTKVPLKFGTTTLTGYIVDENAVDSESENIEYDDEEGKFVIDIAGWGKKKRKTLKVIPLEAVVEPVLGAVLTYGTEYLVVDAIRKVRLKKDVERWDIEGHEHPEIDLTPA